MRKRFQKPPIGPGRRPKRVIVFSRQEADEHLALVARLLANFATDAMVLKAMRTEFGGTDRISRFRVKSLISQIRTEWVQDDPQKREHRRAQQIAMLQDTVQRLSASLSVPNLPWPQRRSMMQARLDHLRMLSQLTGTAQPQEVNVNVQMNVHVTGVVMQAIATLTPDQMNEMLLRQQESERDALEYRKLLAAGTIDVKGEAAE